MKLNLIYDYQNILEYRLSFNELTNKVFAMNFEKWYNKGGWNDRYICYSFAQENKIVANASVSKMDIILDCQRQNTHIKFCANIARGIWPIHGHSQLIFSED